MQVFVNKWQKQFTTYERHKCKISCLQSILQKYIEVLAEERGYKCGLIIVYENHFSCWTLNNNDLRTV